MDDEHIKDIIAEMGESTDRFGCGKTVGQLWAALYFKGPMTQERLKAELDSSTAAVSQAITPLETIGLIKITGKEGRKKIYEVEQSLNKVKRKFLEIKLQYQIEPMLELFSEKKKQMKEKENQEKLNNLIKMHTNIKRVIKTLLALPIWKNQ